MPTDQDLALKSNMDVRSDGPAGLNVKAATDAPAAMTPEELQMQRLLATGKREAIEGAFRFISPLIPPTILATTGAAAMKDYLLGKVAVPGSAGAGLEEAQRAQKYWSEERNAAKFEHEQASQRAWSSSHLPPGDPIGDADEAAEYAAKKARDVTGRFDESYPRTSNFQPPDSDVTGYNEGRMWVPERAGAQLSQPPAEPVRDTPTVVKENLDLARARANVAGRGESAYRGGTGTTTQASQVGARGVAAAERAIGGVLGVGAALGAAAPITVAEEVGHSKDFETILTNMALHNLNMPIPRGTLDEGTLESLKDNQDLVERLYQRGVLSQKLYDDVAAPEAMRKKQVAQSR